MAVATEVLESFEPDTEEENRKLVIFAWSRELDKVWPTLILSTTGAAMGMQTTVFFTFWGLFPLIKNDRREGRLRRLTGENWMQKMLSVMNHGGTEHLKLTRMNFAGAGPAMIRSWPWTTRSPCRPSSWRWPRRWAYDSFLAR
jgi:peroxiredoxin family protein